MTVTCDMWHVTSTLKRTIPKSTLIWVAVLCTLCQWFTPGACVTSTGQCHQDMTMMATHPHQHHKDNNNVMHLANASATQQQWWHGHWERCQRYGSMRMVPMTSDAQHEADKGCQWQWWQCMTWQQQPSHNLFISNIINYKATCEYTHIPINDTQGDIHLYTWGYG